MAAEPKRTYTPEEYLEIDRASEERYEYFNGDIFLMVGASRNHNRIAGSTYASLYMQLRERPCDIFMNDMRVKISSTGLYVYPDIVALCGDGQYEDAEVDTLLNPALVIEVLSASTAKHDHTQKFRDYQTIMSLQEYILITQTEPRIEQYIRQEHNRWTYLVTEGLESRMTLPSIQCTLSLADVYEKVNFEEP